MVVTLNAPDTLDILEEDLHIAAPDNFSRPDRYVVPVWAEKRPKNTYQPEFPAALWGFKTFARDSLTLFCGGNVKLASKKHSY